MMQGGEHAIDCHVLTLPRFDRRWVAELRGDLDAEPVNQHWMAGIEGDLARARAKGFSAGAAPFVSSADPDDRIVPGTYALLAQALRDNPQAAFAWAGEQLVDEALVDLPIGPNVQPGGYHPVSHIARATHVHGVKLYRRKQVVPLLEMMCSAGPCCEFMLDLALVRPWLNPPKLAWPVHVPVVGRLWRQHGGNGSKLFARSDFDCMARVLGFESMAVLREAVYRECTY